MVKINLEVYDMDLKTGELIDLEKTVDVYRVNSFMSTTYFDRGGRTGDIFEEVPENKKYTKTKPFAIWNQKNGLEDFDKVKSQSAIYNKDIVGYLIAAGLTTDTPRNSTLLIQNMAYNAHGFYLREDNFLQKLPMFAAGWWSTYNDKWWLDGVVYRTGDGAERFHADLNKPEMQTWLKRVLFYTCLEYYNKIRSLNGSDDRLYLNKLTLDDMHGNTLALETLKINQPGGLQLNESEQVLYDLWQNIMVQARATANYDPEFTYGPFQIEQELNTKTKDERTRKNVADYPELNGNLRTLRKLIKQYYLDYIVDDLFKYEFLK